MPAALVIPDKVRNAVHARKIGVKRNFPHYQLFRLELMLIIN